MNVLRSSFSLYSIVLAAFCLQLARTAIEDSVDKSQDVPGHLEPLASKNVKHSLEIIQNYPDPKTFFKTYVVKSKPVLIQNAAKLSSAFEKWTDEYFLSRPESSEEKIQAEQGKKEERTKPDKETSFSDFVKSYKEKDIYMVSSVPAFMRVDFVKYPGLIDVEYYNVTMHAGDCLYIPHRWFHQVRSYGRNIAVNLWWQHTPKFVPEDCDGVEQYQTLDNFNFTTLDSAIDDAETTVFFGNNEEMEWTEDMKLTTKKLFKLMDVDKDKSFSTTDLEELEKADDAAMNALTNEYYKLYDLVEKAQDYLDEKNGELYEEDDNEGGGDGDYDIEPIKKTVDENTREEL
ncbi:hypothetical protein OS493_037406 [Desmophyllum pertusum]|uniref:JmjC domain-containing protein n=1 Tax=Desmophyllum pertusum TaxID=174260 RepID=A0A9W9ZII1_9CNID|nr:hypothetical protein OS493_037406 [Desmophyllum pertusum]